MAHVAAEVAALPRCETVPTIDASELSAAEFAERFMRPNKPVLLTGVSNGWRCRSEWTREDQSGERVPDISRMSDLFGDAKVLVVDDNPMNLLVAQKLIEKLGHEVVTSTNGEEAIQAWLAEEPEMIFMDLQMPVMDGMEATKEIRRRMEGKSAYFLSIVALTADAEASTRKEALASGLNDVLVKPASIDQLEHSIQHWCRLHREALA